MNENNTVAQQARYIRMTETPIPKLVGSLAVPTMISMLITSIYNMADTFFVSQLGTSASGAVGIVFSIMAMIQAFGYCFGMGCGQCVSRLLGAQEYDKAEKVVATSIFSCFAFGIVFSTVCLSTLDPLIRFLGATETIAPYAKDYAGVILLGAPYMATSFVLNNMFRAQGNAFFAMFGIGVGGILNVILDPIFIFVFDMGIAGAAWATIICQLVSFIVLLIMNRKLKGTIPIRIKKWTFQWWVYRDILRSGIPSFFRQVLSATVGVMLNKYSAPFGDVAIAAMSIVSRVYQMVISLTVGFGQGFQPVCGFNYGAKRYDRVLKAFWFCVKVAISGLIVLGIIGFIFSNQIIAIFRKEDLEVIAIGSTAIKLYSSAWWVMGLVTMCNMFFQAIGKALYASILALSQQGLFFLLFITILPRFFGILGVQLSMPLANIATFCLAIPMAIRTFKELKHLQTEQEVVKVN